MGIRFTLVAGSLRRALRVLWPSYHTSLALESPGHSKAARVSLTKVIWPGSGGEWSDFPEGGKNVAEDWYPVHLLWCHDASEASPHEAGPKPR